MTHAPPVPPGNQSTFPRQTPPAPIEPPPLMRGVSNSKPSNNVGLILGVGAAAIALAAGALLWLRTGADNRIAKGGKKKPVG